MSQIPQCEHGDRTFKSGTSSKGKPWKAWDCPLGECERQWVNDPKPQGGGGKPAGGRPFVPRLEDDPRYWAAKQRAIAAMSACSSAVAFYAAHPPEAKPGGDHTAEVGILAAKLYKFIMTCTALPAQAAPPAQPAPRPTPPPPPPAPEPPPEEYAGPYGPDPDSDIPF